MKFLKKLKRIKEKYILKLNMKLPSQIRYNKTIVISENVGIDKNTFIGDYTYIGPNSNVTKAVIGRYCSIGGNVNIGVGEHDIEKISLNACFYENIYEELTKNECVISDDVWVGVNAIILRGVKVGRGAVIGAGAIVTKDVAPYSVVVGVPAKEIKKRFSDIKINKIEESKWWKYDEKEARNILNQLQKKI